MSYRDDATRLARALTDLLSTDPLPAEPLLAGQVQAALVCRDTVVGAVRDLTGALLGRTATRLPDAPDLLSRSPAHALHAALRDLPPATGRDLALTDALATGGGRPLPGWQHAARAATALEAYRDDAAALPGPAAWSLARDLATLSSALPALDLDLAATLTATRTATRSATPAVPAGPVAVLLDGPSHGLLQLSATELTAHTADVPPAAALPGRTRQPVRPVNRLADLPVAGGQLADLLHRRGSRLTVTEVRAALRTVAFGLDLTARALAAEQHPGSSAAGGAPDPGDRSALDQAVGQVRQALPDLRIVMQSQLATLTPPAPSVLLLNQQIQTRLAATGRLHDALPADAGAATAHRDLNRALTRWAVTAGPVIEAVRRGLRAATDQQALLAARRDHAPSRYEPLLYLPLPAGAAHPALEAADRAAAAVRGATGSLTALLDPATAGRPSGTRRAAADAAAVFGELTAALQTRPATAWPNPIRTAHPALPRDISRQHPVR